ncbi:uncharacterized GPI-anchored protein At5g19250-like [Malania oleifera]|uniref:uncharacterized GPI-anchored protein At5g19250-like n=1 Tax=Malania oleifera TaxID=397392 RepID=UPI0025ADF1FE|nr:uncharacterized GPI-anchored protein At5g19250-like [Malania oleifera]
MASLRLPLLLSLLLHSILLMEHRVRCDDEEEKLLQGINAYRASLNLTALAKNDNAECLASKMADEFKNQACTNTTGANTVPGTEPLFANYPSLLDKCHLNVNNTRDGAVLPACVPNLDPSLVLSNFTQSQYSQYLNDTQFIGLGIGSDGNWIVVVLTKNTSGGSFVTETADNSASKFGFIHHSLFLLIGSLFL